MYYPPYSSEHADNGVKYCIISVCMSVKLCTVAEKLKSVAGKMGYEQHSRADPTGSVIDASAAKYLQQPTNSCSLVHIQMCQCQAVACRLCQRARTDF
jgi:hypothetical protein